MLARAAALASMTRVYVTCVCWTWTTGPITRVAVSVAVIGTETCSVQHERWHCDDDFCVCARTTTSVGASASCCEGSPCCLSQLSRSFLSLKRSDKSCLQH